MLEPCRGLSPVGKWQLEPCQAHVGHTERCSRGLIAVAAVSGYLDGRMLSCSHAMLSISQPPVCLMQLSSDRQVTWP